MKIFTLDNPQMLLILKVADDLLLTSFDILNKPWPYYLNRLLQIFHICLGLFIFAFPNQEPSVLIRSLLFKRVFLVVFSGTLLYILVLLIYILVCYRIPYTLVLII